VNAAVETRTFGVSSDEVVAIDSWVEQVGLRWGESERTVFRARLCIAELAANVVEHGIPRSGVDRIVVTLRHLGNGIGIEFLDACEPFDSSRKVLVAKPASIETASAGGRGLMLIHAYAEDLAYRDDGTGNRVMLNVTAR
jgi:anti-sigma regulatory factor (Ser/Thr protein kinase)